MVIKAATSGEQALLLNVLKTLGAAELQSVAIGAGLVERAGAATCFDRLVELNDQWTGIQTASSVKTGKNVKIERQITSGNQVQSGRVVKAKQTRKTGTKLKDWPKYRIVKSLVEHAPSMSRSQLRDIAPYLEPCLPAIYEREFGLVRAGIVALQAQQPESAKVRSEQPENGDDVSIQRDPLVLTEDLRGAAVKQEPQQTSLAVLPPASVLDAPECAVGDQPSTAGASKKIDVVCRDTLDVPFDHIFKGPTDQYPCTVRIQMFKRVEDNVTSYGTHLLAGREALRPRTCQQRQFHTEDEARDKFALMDETLKGCGLQVSYPEVSKTEGLATLLVE